MKTRNLIAAGLALTLSAGAAEAAVLCQKKSGQVFVRATGCRKREAALDTTSLGLNSVTVRLGTPVVVTAGSVVNAIASCNAGERAVSGGATPPFGASSTDEVLVVYSAPMTGQINADDGTVPDGWNTRVRNQGGTTATAVPRVVCLSP